MKKFFTAILIILTLTTGCKLTVDPNSTSDSTDATETKVVTDNNKVATDHDIVAPIIVGREIEIETYESSEKTLTERLNTPIEVVSDVGLIEKYYSLIGEGKLEEAYAMKYDTKTTFKTFQGWYVNTASAVVRDIEENPDHKYSFYVDLVNKDKTEETYLVKMEVIDGKLKTNSSVLVPEMSLRLAVKDGIEYLYLDRKGESEIIVTHDTRSIPYEETHIESYKFLQNYKYVSYEILGTAEKTMYIYKISAGKNIFSIFTPGIFGFSNNEKYFYACQGTGMMGGYVSIYKVVGDSINFYKDLGEGMAIWDCGGYNLDKGYFEYTLTPTYGDYSSEKFLRRYYFDKDAVI